MSFTAYQAKSKNSKITKGTYLHVGNKDSSSNVNLIKDQFFLETAMKEYDEYNFFITTNSPIEYLRETPINRKFLQNVIKVERKDRPSGIYFEHKKFNMMTCNHCDCMLFGSVSYDGTECNECEQGQYTSGYQNMYKIIENRKNMADNGAYNKLFVELDEHNLTCFDLLEGVLGVVDDVNNKGGYYQSLIDEGMSEAEIHKKELEEVGKLLNELQERIVKIK